MQLEQLQNQLDELTTAHRHLAARNEALFQMSKIVFPIAMAAHPDLTKQLITMIYDATNNHMDTHQIDDEYQQLVSQHLDELSALLQATQTTERPSPP
jgi:hypothetical protein